jgi:hypothetical protein
VTQPLPQDADSADGPPASRAQRAWSIWQFWLTGGALAIITTVITIVATHDSSGNSSNSQNATTTTTPNGIAPNATPSGGALSTDSVPAVPPTSAQGIPNIRLSGRITLNTQDLAGVDLDSMAPDWSVGDITRTDVDLYFGGISRDLSNTRGTLSATSIGPDSFRECQASTQTSVDIEERTIKKLPLICLRTSEDRIAVVKIVSYDEQRFVFDVAVWAGVGD